MNRSLRALAHQLGMRLRQMPPFTPYWNGETLNLAIIEQAPLESRNGLLAHEIAHLLCAPPERRRVPNYGFGPNARDLSDAPLLLNERAARAEEGLASLAGNVLVAHFAPADLAESLEQTLFVQHVRGQWMCGGGERRLLTLAMRLGVLGSCPIPALRTPFVLVEFLCGQADVLLAPLFGRAAPQSCEEARDRRHA